MKLIVLSAIAVAACTAQSGRVVRPSDHQSVADVERDEVVCPQEEWDNVRSVKGYTNWTAENLNDVDGFTVMLSQYSTTVTSRCFGTQIKYVDGNSLVFMNIYPTQSGDEQVFELGNHFEVDNSTLTNSTSSQAGGSSPSKQIMIAGASPNFVAYATCNRNSSHVNLLVTYRRTITEIEKKAINSWVKKSNLPLLGRWAAINFDTCSLTKTYVCNGGRDAFCSTVSRRHSKNHRGRGDSSSEESGEDYDAEVIFFPW